MKVIDLISPESIEILDGKWEKYEIIDRLIEILPEDKIIDREAFKAEVYERERDISTAIGNDVAIPHARSGAVKDFAISLIVTREDVDFESIDGSLSSIFFLIASNLQGDERHVKLLSSLASMLMDEDFRKKLKSSNSKEEIYKILREKESGVDEIEEEKSPKKKYFVAVTGCPMGISHTYIAEEKLREAAKNLGVEIKVETNGSAGVGNLLNKEDIERAEAVIVAADISVDTDRFDGKRMIRTSVSDGIYKAEDLIKSAISGEGDIHRVSKGNTKHLNKIYRHIMNGVSNMLPFIVAGGILIALSYLLDDFSINPKTFGSNTRLASTLNKIGNILIYFMLPIFSGYTAVSIGDRPALLPGILGGAMVQRAGSGFLGALIAGFLAGYIMLFMKKLFSRLPDTIEGLRPVLFYPVLGAVIMGLLMEILVIPPTVKANSLLTSFLYSLSDDSKLVLGFTLGAMMAVDMGGPVNKAAYLFGTSSLTLGSSQIMAAVMAGGMVPPLITAVATSLFSKKFSKAEIRQGRLNYLMSACFITESAIPFAIKNPNQVIPSSIIGSGIAGLLVMHFGSSLRSPHGGLFVIGIIEKPLGFLISILVGGVLGGIIYGFSKTE